MNSSYLKANKHLVKSLILGGKIFQIEKLLVVVPVPLELAEFLVDLIEDLIETLPSLG